MLIQQGDVIIESVLEMVVGNIGPIKDGKIILAEGESTGHAHRISDIAGVEFIEKNGFFWLKNPTQLTVTHEEHKPVIIPAGIWRIGKVREYDHFAEEARAVAD